MTNQYIEKSFERNGLRAAGARWMDLFYVAVKKLLQKMHILHELGKPKLDLVVSRESRIDSLVLQALATVQLRVCVILAPGIQKGNVSKD